MEFLVLQSFNNYVDAHLLLARLESEGIECWLKDENTVTINPIWTNAVGGIKLMVKKEDYNRASAIFQETEKARKHAVECPRCKSHNVDFISTPRKAGNWISAILGFLFISYALPVNNVYHCFDCGNEFENTDNNPPCIKFFGVTFQQSKLAVCGTPCCVISILLKSGRWNEWLSLLAVC